MKTTFPPAPFPWKGVAAAHFVRSFTLRRLGTALRAAPALPRSAANPPLPQGRPKARAAKSIESRRDEHSSPLCLGKGSGERQL